MKRLWFSGLLAAVTLALGFGPAGRSSAAPLDEKTAPAAVQKKLAEMRKTIQAKDLTFEVGYTSALKHPQDRLTGLKLPADFAIRAAKQKLLAAKFLELDRSARDAYDKAHPGTLPEMAAAARPPATPPKAFSWRDRGKVTPIRDQG